MWDGAIRVYATGNTICAKDQSALEDASIRFSVNARVCMADSNKSVPAGILEIRMYLTGMLFI